MYFCEETCPGNFGEQSVTEHTQVSESTVMDFGSDTGVFMLKPRREGDDVSLGHSGDDTVQFHLAQRGEVRVGVEVDKGSGGDLLVNHQGTLLMQRET